MGYALTRNADKIAYGLVELVVDTESEVSTIDIADFAMGSKCFVIETSTTYMLNSKDVWQKIANTGGGSGGGSAEIEALNNKVDKLSANVLYRADAKPL